MISVETLKHHVAYNPLTGELTGLVGNRKGKPVLCTVVDGYKRGRVCGVWVKAHRAAWALMTGEWPEEIDHENGDGTDNRWLNLRNGSHADNARNMKLYRNNTSGVVGVSYCKRRGKWTARCRGRNLGYYDDKEEAVSVRKEAENAEGFHPNHGRFTAHEA